MGIKHTSSKPKKKNYSHMLELLNIKSKKKKKLNKRQEKERLIN